MANNPNQLVVLTRARALAVHVHRAVERRERLIGKASPGLRNQMLRAAMSIPLHIAEGAGKDTRVDFARFLGNAFGSANEVEQQLPLAPALRVFDRELDPLIDQCREIRMLLYGLRQRLQNPD
ncbi:four helix bundle protein [Gemmatimonas sp.]|uniref:four helix bundle protein n=1 Tax=Gemmatimonas sp. TaxID=1962908 RepID=UPI0039830AD9